jgi:GMP synthase-like glutamine amidotransferase
MKIGLTQRVLFHKNRAHDSIEHGWYNYLRGHTLVFIPNDPSLDFTSTADDLDLLIITGGDDSAVRRATELKVASQVLLRKKPILGICHGAFLLTDVLGGSVAPCEGHMDTEHQIFYDDQVRVVNSYHTHTITLPHRSATTLVRDDNGNCEAWIDGNVAGIVWHPERMTDPWIPPEISHKIAI